MKVDITSIIAISGIVILEIVALSKGVNGVMLSTSLAIIGGVAGYTLSKKI